MRRYDALKQISRLITPEDLVVTSIDWIKNEWYSVMPGDGTFFSALLGNATPFALGMALALPHRRVVALDTDGSMLFGAGALCTVSVERPPNLTVLVFDNEAYEGVGEFPTHTRRGIQIDRLAAGAGIARTGVVRDPDELVSAAGEMLNDGELGLLVVKVEPGRQMTFPPELTKRTDGLEDKYRFIRHIERMEQVSIRPPVLND